MVRHKREESRPGGPPALRHVPLKRRIPAARHVRGRLQASVGPRMSLDNASHRPTIHRLRQSPRSKSPQVFRPPRPASTPPAGNGEDSSKRSVGRSPPGSEPAHGARPSLSSKLHPRLAINRLWNGMRPRPEEQYFDRGRLSLKTLPTTEGQGRSCRRGEARPGDSI